MKQIIKFRWWIAFLWVVVAVALLLFGPNLQTLVAEKGQMTVPDDNTSIQADKLLQKMNEDGTSAYDAVLVFHNEDMLTKTDEEEITKAIDILQKNQENLAISDIIDFREGEEVKDLTVAEDGTTIIVPFKVSVEDRSANEARDMITELIANIPVDHHVTGEIFLQEDIIINSEEGLEKTLSITVVLILIILFLVFKSFVAPLIPLLTVGISYLISEGIVAILADTMDFPLSTFSQIFMVAVMFGIGTDYCILLISRFKEEINQHETIGEAVIATYQASGKTVFFAGLAVLIGFSTIGFSSFTLYQSAVAVAIGVAVILIALVTLVPFFLILLGKRLFWPFDKKVEHKESRIWKTAGVFAWRRPIFALFIIAIITVPSLLTYNGDKSYDSLEELSDGFGSVIAFNWITESFGPGETLPTTVVMEVDEPITSAEDYQAIETISQEINRIKGVDYVRSATRPAGDVIEDFLMESQTEQLSDGLGEGVDGLNEVEDGLREAADELKNESPKLNDAKDGVGELMDGTNAANDGIGQIQTALTEIEQGIMSGSSGAGEVKAGLEEVKRNLDETIAGNKQILSGYTQIAEGLAGFGEMDSVNLSQLKQAVEGAKASVEGMNQISIAYNPNLETDPSYQEAYQSAVGVLDGLAEGVNQIEEELGKLSGASEQLQTEVVQPLNQLNNSFQEVISGQEQLSTALDELIAGISQLESGLSEAASGQKQVVNEFPNLREGLSQIYGGQSELKNAFEELQEGLDELSGGLVEGSDGLSQIDEGLTTVQEYLGDFSVDQEPPVVIIPEEAVENDDFLEGANEYLSDDKKVVKFDVILDYSPYSQEAIELVGDINDAAQTGIENTKFAGSMPEIGGVSSLNNDLKNVSDEDYSRTALYMLIGIFIILVILFRSLTMPLYLIGSLLLTYYTSLGFAELIFVNIFGYDGLTWVIPFFSFVMLVALGIDYSIFLMDRFNEYKNGFIKDALINAMKNMGTVIISATIILGGTFGAMLPSGVLSLLQIATVVIIGLVLYAFLMLPLFTPIMVRFFGKYNWWPFKNQMKS
ncbi:MMPL family transporter [Pseudogracilibacillus sp. SO30301A]|uniref:MMPL family transporter n=1 Tax=Pseudogracilibacillus sp. SO30301A TaxID=3098291 RepID=UPI00300DE280